MSEHNSQQERRPGGFSVQTWHIVLMLIIQMLVLAFTYGRITQSVDDLGHRLAIIEDGKLIGRDEFNSFVTQSQENQERLEREILERNEIEKRQ